MKTTARSREADEIALEREVATFRGMSERAKDSVYRTMWTLRADEAAAQLASLRGEVRATT